MNKIQTPPTTSDLVGKINELIDDKQDTISDLATIRSGAALGATSVQPSDLSTYVTTNTAQDITARKTFFGEKAIYFKQNTSSDKLGFTLYNNNNKEVGALEFRPNTINGTPILTLNSASPNSASYVGFRYWSYALNILAPFSTSFGYNKNFFIPVTFTNGTTTVESTSTNGSVDISSLLPTKTSDLTNDSGYITASSLPTVNNATLTITQGGVSKGTFTANASSDVTIALDAGGSDVEAFTAAEVQTLWESL